MTPNSGHSFVDREIQRLAAAMLLSGVSAIVGGILFGLIGLFGGLVVGGYVGIKIAQHYSHLDRMEHGGGIPDERGGNAMRREQQDAGTHRPTEERRFNRRE